MSARTASAVALLTFVLAVSVFACGGGKSVTGDGQTSSSTPVASVTVSPALDTAVSIGESIAFTAKARDAGGSVLTGVSISWSSSDASVAAVAANGQATARGNGTTLIVASASGKADTATLVVSQQAASVAMSPDSARVSAPGDTARFSAAATDANGHDVPGVRFDWSVSDTTVATIDSAGLVTARQFGRVTVTAAVAGVTGIASLRVAAVTAPTIASVSPSPLQEGQPATITGQDFEANAAGDTVVVDGVPATVTSASTTTLQITVPRYDCLPPRDVAVRVATLGGAAQTSSSLDPAQAPLSLGAGQQLLVTDPMRFCIQFPAAADSERYIVGVQSLTSVGATLTPVTVTSEAADGSGAASVVPIFPSVRTPGGGASGQDIQLPAWVEEQRRAEAHLRAWERAHLDPRASIPATSTGAARPPISLSVTGGVAVGDTVQLRVPDAGSNDPCNAYDDVTATVQAIGTRAIIVADTANPANGFTQADYQNLSDQLDSQIFATDVAYFGDPGDIDANGHIVVLFTKSVNAATAGVPGTILLGFVFAGDLFPRFSTTGTYCASSDVGEIYYGRVPDPTGIYGARSTRTQELSRAPATMAHELVHLIQNGRRFAEGNSFMAPTLAEGQAVLGEEVVGHDVTGRQPYQNYGFDVAFNTSGTDVIDWYAPAVSDLFYYFGYAGTSQRTDGAPEQCGWWRSDPSPCSGRSLWYGVGWSFLRWLSDRYGPSYSGGERGLQQALIGDAATGLQAAADVTGVSLDTLMARWSAALYVDDRVTNPDPALTFSSWNLYDFELNTSSNAHLLPLEEPFADWTASKDVRASSTAYIALDGSGRPATAVRVRGTGGITLPSYMQVWVVRIR